MPGCYSQCSMLAAFLVAVVVFFFFFCCLLGILHAYARIFTSMMRNARRAPGQTRQEFAERGELANMDLLDANYTRECATYRSDARNI